ncbi:PREDICTED: probable ADP-ribosylation factor GTPase-activating protein AGD14 isoform X3 [Lupinus angustifolius]|uniref:probable ADP-ribosylation factor GTPase-activating protein AGD14 isoform X3 n=1 Tax=Lupinus angustifolius TaxID=3871 RepID=UPI00092FAEA0|nr:PREDICTED: probable ADP-ribosylation factor GTPase-activating protein AGD14 isoform X3 [Lupinus angustifolius]
MFTSKKEDAKIEKEIRGLLKLPANRRCINCNVLGPQYVCTTFNTFVCINCSGIHREFTHRVKSVSMAKFTPEEVAALEAGGNERAKQIYFKEWDSQRHSYPDSNNMHRLRDFIKHVYVDRKFTGERGAVVLPRLKLKDKEDPYENKKISSFRMESKSSPHYEDRIERYNSDRSSPGIRSDDKNLRFYYDETRSPKYAQRCAKPGTFGRSPIKFEVVDDRFRDDESRNRRLSNLESKFKQLQPDLQQKNVEGSQAYVARPVREVSNENGSSPKVGEPFQPQNKAAAQSQVIGDSSAVKKPSEQKNNPPEKSAASYAAAGPETQSIPQSSENNWASFDAFTDDNAPETSISTAMTSSIIETTPKATYANSLDLLLSELSGPVTAATGAMFEDSHSGNNPPTATARKENACGDLKHLPPTSMWQTTATPTISDALSVTSTTVNDMKQSSTAAPPQVDLYNIDKCVKVSQEQTLPSIQFPPSTLVSSSMTQPSTPVSCVASNDLLSDVPNSCDSFGAITEMSSQTTSKPAQNTKPDVGSQISSVETKPSGRMELPADLFTTSYSSGPAPVTGWQNVQHCGKGYGLQYYPNAMPPSAFPFAAKSLNPFDQTEGKPLAHASSFPTLASMNGVLPDASPLMHSSSFSSLGSMLPQTPSYASPIAPQSTLPSEFPSGLYFGQVNNNMQPPSFNGSPNSSYSKMGVGGGNPFESV